MKVLELTQTVEMVTGPEATERKGINAVIEVDGTNETLSIVDSHPNYQKVYDSLNLLLAGEITNEEFAEKFYNAANLVQSVSEKIEAVTRIDGMDGRLTISGGRVFVDHEPIDSALEAHILRMLQEDGSPKDLNNWTSFVRFIENLYSNQSEFVRQQLFGWIQYENMFGVGLTLTSDGCLIGYKGCAGTVEEPVSVHAGPAIVNGVKMNGQIPNVPGSIVEMPRSLVTDDPQIGCSSGLHVGTYNYASDWARGVLLTVKVNPRDIVSVPTECSAQKIRTCRYEVLEAVEGPLNELSYGFDDESDWGDDESYCEICGWEGCGYCGECSCCEDCEDREDCEPSNELDEEVLEEESKLNKFADRFARVASDFTQTASDVYQKARETLTNTAQAVTDALSREFYENAAKKNLTLKFDYVDKAGVSSTGRVLTVESFDPQSETITGKIPGGRGFRTFLTENMSKVTVMKSEEVLNEDLAKEKLRVGNTVTLSMIDGSTVVGKVVGVVEPSHVVVDVEGTAKVYSTKEIASVQ